MSPATLHPFGISPSASETITPAAFLIFEKLLPNLVTLMGEDGFRVLLSRALVIADREVPWLRTMQVNADGALAGRAESLARIDGEQFLRGRAILWTHLLGLMVDLTGEDMTLSVLRDIWPRASLNDCDHLSEGEKE